MTTKVQEIHQIEITSNCNLRCRYCVHPTMSRAKVDMDMETFERALYWVEQFRLDGTQGELNLAGIGESTLHPNFIEMVEQARRAVGKRGRLHLATNGVKLTEEHADALARCNVGTAVSLHRPEKAKRAVDMIRKRGILVGASTDPALASVDWAGQIEWDVTAPKAAHQCLWLVRGWAFVRADGDVGTCGFDGRAESDGVIGTVLDDVRELRIEPYSLCKTCNQFLPQQ